MSRLWTLTLAALFSLMALPLVTAQEKKPADKPAATEEKKEEKKEAPDRYAVPEEANVAELVSFIKEIKSFRPTSQADLINHYQKSPIALKGAAEKLLKLEKDTKSAAWKLANSTLLMQESRDIRSATPAEKAAFFARAKDHIAASDKTSEEAGLAMNVAMAFEYGEARDLAAKAYTEFGELLAKSEDKEVAERAKVLIGAARRMNLVGNAVELKGTTMDGKEFNIANLKGKVVLVDYWATWCGPCIAEYPNIKKNYEAYHDKGFEVIGVSLDEDRGALEKYVEEKHVPWVTLHEKGAGWRSTAATYYGILGIPTVILVNKEGKVISLNARGPELGKLLEKELGPAPDVKVDVKAEDPKASAKKLEDDRKK